MFHPANHTGFLAEKLKRIGTLNGSNQQQQTMTEEEIRKMVEFFVDCGGSDKVLIENELKRTAVVRQQLWKNGDERLPKMPNLYLVDPNWVNIRKK